MELLYSMQLLKFNEKKKLSGSLLKKKTDYTNLHVGQTPHRTVSLLHCFWPFIYLYHQLNKGSSKHSTLVHNWVSKVKFTSISYVVCPLVILCKYINK